MSSSGGSNCDRIPTVAREDPSRPRMPPLAGGDASCPRIPPPESDDIAEPHQDGSCMGSIGVGSKGDSHVLFGPHIPIGGGGAPPHGTMAPAIEGADGLCCELSGLALPGSCSSIEGGKSPDTVK